MPTLGRLGRIGSVKKTGLRLPPVPWTPTELTALALWLDAADAATVTITGSGVSTWAGKAASRNAVQTTDSFRPTYSATGWVDGVKPAVIGASLKYFDLSSSVPAYNGTTGLSAMAVVGRDTGANSRVVIGSTLSGAPQLEISTGHTIRHLRANQALLAASAAAGTGGRIIGMDGSLNASAVWLDGVGVSNTNDPAYTQQINMLLSFNTVNNFIGPVGEILISTTKWTTDERQKVEGYLAHKWGLTANLASGHPYKNGVPTV